MDTRPSAIACFREGSEECLAHLEHHQPTMGHG